MPVPTSMTDLSATAASNSPAGSDVATSSTGPDDYLRALSALVRREQAQGANVASATTVNLGAIADGNYVHITGTTTITGFGTVAAGIERTVVFDGVLTLTHNATSLILPSGANIATAAGDVATFISEGSGNWRCKHYGNISGLIHAAPDKTAPVGADEVGVWNSVTGLLNRVSLTNLGATIAPNLNLIQGGDFTTNPWQRGTSFTAPAGDTHLSDRFKMSYMTSAVINALRTADAPTATQAGVHSAHCLHIDVTTADTSIDAGDYFLLRQYVEGFNVAPLGFGQAGTRYATLSFWHKHTKTGTYCVAFNNGTSTRSYVSEYTQAVANTWEKASITIPVDTTGTWLYDTGKGLAVVFVLACGSTYQTAANTWAAGAYFSTANQVNALDSTANDFKIALVQLEAGTTATQFEHRTAGQELALCQRYYYRISAGDGLPLCNIYSVVTNGTARGINTFHVSMRIAPTALEQSGTAGEYALFVANTVTSCASVPSFSVATKDYAQTVFTTTSGHTAGQAGVAAVNKVGGNYLGWSAEL